MKTEVTAGILGAAAAGIVSGVLAAVTAFWALIATVPGQIGLTQKGAVEAFNLKSCPAGWSDFQEGRARVLIGAATDEDIKTMPNKFASDARGVRLTSKPLFEPDGQEGYLLSQRNIPAHQHDTILGDGDRGQTHTGPWGDTDVLPAVIAARGPVPNSMAAKTSFYGASEQELKLVPTMPPYVALRFCTKL